MIDAALLERLIPVAIGCVLVVLVRIWVVESDGIQNQRVRGDGALTWIAVIIVAVWIWEGKLTLMKATAVGVGVGFAVKTLIATAGGRVIGAVTAFLDALGGKRDR